MKKWDLGGIRYIEETTVGIYPKYFKKEPTLSLSDLWAHWVCRAIWMESQLSSNVSQLPHIPIAILSGIYCPNSKTSYWKQRRNFCVLTGDSGAVTKDFGGFPYQLRLWWLSTSTSSWNYTLPTVWVGHLVHWHVWHQTCSLWCSPLWLLYNISEYLVEWGIQWHTRHVLEPYGFPTPRMLQISRGIVFGALSGATSRAHLCV